MAMLGETLKAARERMGASTSQAAAATRIKVQHIEAMEAGQFQRIPAPTYAKGFIRMYAQYLGLDPAALVKEYVERHMPPTRQSIMPTDETPARASLVSPATP
jgi:cytoskeleton protein RodZ